MTCRALDLDERLACKPDARSELRLREALTLPDDPYSLAEAQISHRAPSSKCRFLSRRRVGVEG
jgi:hypothetical protein